MKDKKLTQQVLRKKMSLSGLKCLKNKVWEIFKEKYIIFFLNESDNQKFVVYYFTLQTSCPAKPSLSSYNPEHSLLIKLVDTLILGSPKSFLILAYR